MKPALMVRAVPRAFWPITAGIGALWLTSPCRAQDSVAAPDSGMHSTRQGSILESKLFKAPVLWARRVHHALSERGIHPGASSQGPNSGFGPILRVGRNPDTSAGHYAGIQGGWTYRNYWHAEVRAGRHWLELVGRREERPRDIFFGIGNGTDETDWSDYALRRLTIGARAARRISPRVRLAALLDWSHVKTAGGSDDSRPDIDSLFAVAERPGFGASHYAFSLSAGISWRAGARHTAERRGSRLAVQYRWNHSQSSGLANFGVLRVAAGWELPFARRRCSVALGTSLETLRPASPGIVPFYALPAIGGPSSLPSFRSERFRGPEAIVGEIEYRQRVWRDRADRFWLDATVFTVGGIVATRLLDALGSATVHQSTGVAVALITRQATVMRLGVSKGADGIGITIGSLAEWAMR